MCVFWHDVGVCHLSILTLSCSIFKWGVPMVLIQSKIKWENPFTIQTWMWCRKCFLCFLRVSVKSLAWFWIHKLNKLWPKMLLVLDLNWWIWSEVDFRDLFGSFCWQMLFFLLLNLFLWIEALLALETQHQMFCSIWMCIPVDLSAIFWGVDLI